MNTLTRLLAFVCLSLTALACGGKGDGALENPRPPAPLSGSAFKGPFLSGATLSAWTLDERAALTGEPLTITIEDDTTFTLPPRPADEPVWVSIEGEVFDEARGEESEDTFALDGVGLAGEEGGVHINLFSDLVAHRVSALMREGAAFLAARSSARQEIELIIGPGGFPEHVEVLGEGDGAMRARILLYSAGFMSAEIDQEAWQEVRDDFMEDGRIDGEGLATHTEIIASAREGGPELYAAVFDHLSARGDAPPEWQGGSDMLFGGCLAASFASPGRVICEGSSLTTREPLAKEEIFTISFLPDIAGRHLLVLNHPECTQGSISIGETGGIPLTRQGITEVIIAGRQSPGEGIDIGVSHFCEEAADFTFSLSRIADGSSAHFIELPARHVIKGRAAAAWNDPDVRQAYYKVSGAASLSLTRYASQGGVTLDVFEDEAMSELVSSQSESSGSGIVEALDPLAGTYYVRVRLDAHAPGPSVIIPESFQLQTSP